MKIVLELEDKEAQTIISVLTSVDPSGVFIGNLVKEMKKQYVNQINQVQIVEKKEQVNLQPKIFGGK